MRRRNLIELLNLYIDGEIASGDQDRLEREISENPESRRLYAQYCRLDEATRQVYRQFRLEAPPESMPDRVGSTPFFSPMGRLRRISLVAGSVAAVIALVSGGLVVFGPTMPENATEAIALAGADSPPATTIVAIAPSVQSFGSVSSAFVLQPTFYGTQVPANWKTRIEIPAAVGVIPVAPEAWPVYGGIRWNAPQRIVSGFGLSNFEGTRVYRGPEGGNGETSRQVLFQFRK